MRICARFVCLFASLSLIGCVAKTIPLAPHSTDSVRGGSLVSIVPVGPRFRAQTPGRVMTSAIVGFGLFGGLVADAVVKSKGRALCEETGISDPAITISRMLAPRVASRMQASYTGTSEGRVDEEDPDDLSDIFSGTSLLLSVLTESWGFNYYPFHSAYRVIYQGRIQLIDTRNSEVIAQVGCQYDPNYSDRAPSQQFPSESARERGGNF
jgi:hypothetical protein